MIRLSSLIKLLGHMTYKKIVLGGVVISMCVYGVSDFLLLLFSFLLKYCDKCFNFYSIFIVYLLT